MRSYTAATYTMPMHSNPIPVIAAGGVAGATAGAFAAYRALPPVAKFMLWGATGVSIAAIGYATYRWATTPVPFTVESDQCNKYKMGSQYQLDEAITPIVKYHAKFRAGIDPFAITTEVIHKYGKSCKSYPEESRNPGEAALYVDVFKEVLRVMDAQKLLSSNQRDYFGRMIDVWARAHSVFAPVSGARTVEGPIIDVEPVQA